MRRRNGPTGGLRRHAVVALLMVGTGAAVWRLQSTPASSFYDPFESLLSFHSTSIQQQPISTLKSNMPSSNYGLAYRESLGFFDDISDAQWRLYQDRARSESLFQRPDNPEQGVESSVALWMLNNVDPIFTCPHPRRVGGRGDGPKWICDPHRLRQHAMKDCLVYSVGSAGKYEFEDGLVQLVGDRHCEIHVFDPNPAFARPGDVEQRNM